MSWRGEETNMQNRQIDNKSTKQVRIDAGLHQRLKIKAAESSVPIKELLEDYLSELLEVKGELIHDPAKINNE